MNTLILKKPEELNLIRDQWNELSAGNPFRSWDWHCSLYEHYYRSNRGFVIAEQSPVDGTISYIAPLYTTRSALGFRKLCFAGDGKICTDYSQLICKSGEFSYSVAKFLIALRRLNRFSIFEFGGLEANTDQTKNLIRQFSRAGMKLDVTFLENTWITRLKDSWQNTNQQFSKKHRRKTKKAIANLGDLEVVYLNQTEFSWAWKNFVQLHQLRRSAVGDKGCFADSKFESFLQAAVQRLRLRNQADILTIQRDGRPIASTLIFQGPETMYMYQTGFDPEFSKLEPGYLLIVAAMKKAIRLGLKTFDFMRGNEPYKAKWNAQPNSLIQISTKLTDHPGLILQDKIVQTRNLVKTSVEYFQGQAQSNKLTA
ncbi:MAG: GNAT family N-acetyltransferase [Planctomycetota bacterium]